MQDQIRTDLHNPRQLEKLYREDKRAFKGAFDALYPELQDQEVARFWHERLHYGSEELSRASGQELAFVVIASLVAGLIAKLPDILGLDKEFFYSRNIGFIVFPLLTAYFAWKNRLQPGQLASIGGATLLGLVYINFLPDNKSDTLLLACIHLPFLLWAMLGFAFTGDRPGDYERRLDFLRYNGELVVMATVIGIAGGLLSGITLGLFSLIGLDIENFYFNNVVIFGLAAVPVVGTYLTRANPHLVSRVSPVIARIFSPLVLVMLLAYLAAIIFSGKNPYNNREFLLVFNALLIGVMAIIFFSVAGSEEAARNRTETLVLFLLSAVTIIVNGIALSAILFRISEWGVTPNRIAVLGGNLLILVHLLLVTVRLFRALAKGAGSGEVGKSIASYLPVYALWAVVVVFIFPLLFGFN
jgi:fumarate reductase subunit C